MSSRLKLAGICFAAAFGLAACGGGGSPLDTARAERDRLAAELAQVIAARDAAEAQVTALTGQLSSAETDRDAAQAQVTALTGQLSDAETARDAAQAEVADLTGQLSETEMARDAAQTQVEDLTGQLGTANDDLATAQDNLQNALDQGVTDQAEIDRLTQAVTDAEGMRDSVQSQLDTANTDLTTANDRITELQGDLDTANADLTTANDRVTELEGDLDTANSNLATANARITELEGQLASANAVNGLFAAAQTSRANADAAVEAAGDAVDNAVKYAGMLDVISVKGNSAEAAANAGKVLMAEMDANQAVRDAEAAQTAAESALAAATALEDSATKAGLVAALEAAVEYAKSQVTAAVAARDVNPMTSDDPPVVTPAVDSLAEAVAKVTGGENADPQGTPKSIGDGVAMAVGGALLPTNTTEGSLDGTAVRVTHYDGTSGSEVPADAPAIADRTYHTHNSPGMTWAQIVGEANVMDVRRFESSAIRQVKAMSVMGSMASDLAAAADTPLPPDTDDVTDGIQNADGNSYDAMYKGIGGTVFCAGSDCGRDADGNLTGSWYFTPDSTTAVFIENPDATARAATPYVAHTAYVQWGHWLTVGVSPDGAGEVRVHTYATTGANIENLNVGVATGCDPECTATYTGRAAGMSLHKTFDGNGDQLTIDSGAFTARVSLTARFGTAPMLSGTIDQFRGGPQVDTGWSVDLKDTAINTTTAAVADGVAKGSGQAGDWAAQGYGPAQTPADSSTTPTTPAVNHRPDGFFGSFNAHFTDGHAAGAFFAE